MEEQIIQEQNLYSMIPVETAKRTFKFYEKDPFITFLKKEYGDGKAKDLIDKFNIGCAKDGTLVWYLDFKNQYRTGQIITVDRYTGCVNKVCEELAHDKFALQHNVKFTPKYCVFGEHRFLDSMFSPKGLVENPLLAIILSALVKDVFWYAPPIQPPFDIKSFASRCDQAEFFIFPSQNNLTAWAEALTDATSDDLIVSDSLVELYPQIELNGLKKNSPHMQTVLSRVSEIVANGTSS